MTLSDLGTVTTTFVREALRAAATAQPLPLTRMKKTRVLPLPGRKLRPRTVNDLPTSTRLGLNDLTTGALLEAACALRIAMCSGSAEAAEGTSAAMSSAAGRSARRV